MSIDLSRISLDRPPMADGDYWSPDAGEFVVRDGLMYLQSGDIWDSRTAIIRMGFGNPKCAEDYSAWDEDQRCLALAISQAKRDAYTDQEMAERARVLALLRSAKAKLTEDEFDAVFQAECRDLEDKELEVRP